MTVIPKIGIVACGAGGLATGLDYNHRLGELAKIFVSKEHPGYSHMVRKQKGIIEVYMALEGHYKVDIVEDLSKLVDECKWIFVTSHTGGHEDIIHRLLPYKSLLKETTIIFVTGNGTSIIADERLGPKNTIEIARLPYTCRADIIEQEKLRIRLNGFKHRVVAAASQKVDDETKAIFDTISGTMSDFKSSPSFLDILFVMNHGYIHLPTMLRGRKFVEKGYKLYLYRDLITPAVCEEILAAYEQLCDLARKLCLRKPEHPVEVFNKDYGTNYGLDLEGLTRFVKECEALNRVPALPSSMKERQVVQEATFICPLWISMARAVKVNFSIIESWVEEAGNINGVDYMQIGRTLAYYGLPEDASVTSIRTRFGLPGLDASH